MELHKQDDTTIVTIVFSFVLVLRPGILVNDYIYNAFQGPAIMEKQKKVRN